MIAAEGVPLVPASGLIHTTVHVEVYVSTWLHFTLDERVCMQDVDELSIAGVQLLVLADGDEERHGRVEAGDARQLVRAQVVGRVGGHVSAEREADHVDVYRPEVAQSRDQLG